MIWSRQLTLALCLSGFLSGGNAGAQSSGGSAGSHDSSSVSYEQRYEALKQLQAVPNRVATVQRLVLTRDAGRFTLNGGKLYLLTPIGGRVVGAVFIGEGMFSFSPPDRIEQERLARFQKTRSLEAPFSSLLLLFADSTLAELESQLTFAAEEPPGDVRHRFKSGFDYLVHDDSKSLHPDLMSAFLNAESTGIFYADIERTGGGPLMFMLNPHEVEGVTLSHRAARYGWTRRSEVICRFPPAQRPRSTLAADGQITGERIHQATIDRYSIITSLTPTGSGDLSFAAAAKLNIRTNAPMGPWIAFSLFEKLKIDSARWESGAPATVFKGKEADLLWVKLESRMLPGQQRSLELFYRGDLIDRYDDFFFIKSSASWYPRPLEGRSLATFDLTFHSPKGKLLASVGDQVDSSTSGQVTTSRWITPAPIRNATFNLGIFKNHEIEEEGIPPVTVMVAEDAHRRLGGLRQKRMKETVGADVAKSLRFFQYVYGPLPAKRLYATEIPYFHGEAFPGMLHLSWLTFQHTDQAGEHEVFRAHEVAHQWWGIGVDFTSYHDQWLSEGFADFSGLWYLQTVRKDKDKYFDMLRRWRARILEHNDDPGPIWLGYRTTSSKDGTGFDVAVYKKGAWVLHMLRILMLDLKTMNEDRFTVMMRDFYSTYQGKRASTDDFRRVVERHVGTDMGWFFDQWIYRSEIPTYRVSYRTEPAEGGQYRVKLQVKQENVADDFQMYVPVTLDLGGDRQFRTRVKVRGPMSTIDLPLLPANPKSLRFNDLDGVLAQVKMD
jgi:hypothetical protein